MPRMIPAHREVAHHVPQVIDPNISPSSFRFTRTVQTPNLFHLTAELFSNNLLKSVSGIANSRGEDNEVCV